MNAFRLRVSRPGLWFQTIWLYLLPTSGREDLLASWRFWLGLVFVSYPLNLLVYGWNDVVDREIDQQNPRKGSWIFGARGSREELQRLPRFIAAVFVPSAVVLAAIEPRLALVLAAMVAVNAAYNAPRRGLRTRPPFELLNQLGYLLILPFSFWLNEVEPVRWEVVGYLVLFCTHAHLIGEVMDVEPDRASGRSTTATAIGVRATKAIVLALVVAEGCLLALVFDELVLGGFLLLGALWLFADLALLDPARRYSRGEYRLLGIALNLSGFASIAWIWLRGGLR
ncbi:MAG TPA: UbiA family prenyltransferase [Thermoanaerobaculia bacterium]|nr:UbiA family prenyltransferase [Thermoanaerobaculia bacterium]